MENSETLTEQTNSNGSASSKPAPVKFMKTLLGDLAVVTPEEEDRFRPMAN